MDELSLYVLDITMNSVRAGATEITITLREDGEWLWFTVEDNGGGFAPDAMNDEAPHTGLQNVRERLMLMCGGTLEITSTSEGSVVTVRIPK